MSEAANVVETDDIIETAIEGIDKLVENDFYGVPQKAKKKGEHLGEKVNHIPERARDFGARHDLPVPRHLAGGHGTHGNSDVSDPNRRLHPHRRSRNREERLLDHAPDMSSPSEAPSRFRESWDQNPPASSSSTTRGQRGSLHQRPSSADPSLRSERYARASLPQSNLNPRGGGENDVLYYENDSYDGNYQTPRTRSASGRGEGRHRYRRDDDYRREYSPSSGSGDDYDEPRTPRSKGESERERQIVKHQERAARVEREKERLRRGKGEKERDQNPFNASAWGAIAGGLVGSEFGRKKNPIISTVVGAGIGALGGKAFDHQRKKKESGSRDEREKRYRN